MKKKLSFLLAGALFLLSIITAACAFPKGSSPAAEQTPSAEKTGSKGQEETAKGRYREELISFPVPVKNIFDMEKKDGGVRILLEPEPGAFCCCKSSDGGVTWQQEPWDNAWLPENHRVVSACFAPEGNILASVGKISENPLDEQHAVGAYTYFKLKETDHGLQPEPLSLDVPEPKEEYLKAGYGLSSIACSEEGNLYGVLISTLGEENTFQIISFDMQSGAVNWKRDAKAAEIQVYENTLYLNEHDGAFKKLDAESGTDLAETASPSGNVFFHLMDMDQEKKKIFYCSQTGIYGADDSMALTELLVDGALSSFSDISYDIQYFRCVSENVFLMFLQNYASGETKLLRYEYDAKLPTQPEQELKVYSLSSDHMVKKLISDFRSSHPDVFVTYEVGMEDSGAKTESDAVNILNTEIMAGNGPDILFLNGLPWNSYLEQGILEDFSSELKSCLKDDEAFQNLFSAYETEGRQYVVPISFSIPILAGEESQIAQASSLDGLLEMVNQTENLPPLIASNFLPYAFSIFWQDIQKEDGSISRDKIKNLLETVKTYNDLLQPKEDDVWPIFQAVSAENEEEPCHTLAKPSIYVWDIVYGNAAAGVGYLGSIRDFTAISDHIPGQNLAWRLFPEHVFTSHIAGINRKSSQPDLAREFLGFALSEEEQKIFIDGSLLVFPEFPVNKEVWRAMAAEPSESDLEGYGDAFRKLGGSFRWPAQEEFDELEKEVSELTTPAMEDTVVIRTILDCGKSYLSGGKSLDGAVSEIMQTLELYDAE